MKKFQNQTNLMNSLDIAQELVRRPSVNPLHDPKSLGENKVVDWLEQWGKSTI